MFKERLILLTATTILFALAATCPTDAKAEVVCEKFDSFMPGAVGWSFTTLPAFPDSFHVFRFEDDAGAFPLEIVDMFGSRVLDWSYAASIQIVAPNLKRPLKVRFVLHAFASPVNVMAFGRDGGLVFDKWYEWGTHGVSINAEEPIHMIRLVEGDNETWIDNVCAAW